jgi:hypothetical protein
MSDLSDVLCSEMKKFFDVNISFAGGYQDFKSLEIFRRLGNLCAVESKLAMIDQPNQKDFYLFWEDSKTYGRLVAVAFPEAYHNFEESLLDAVVLHLKQLKSVKNCILPKHLEEHVSENNLHTLKTEELYSQEPTYIGGNIADYIRTMKSFFI